MKKNKYNFKKGEKVFLKGDKVTVNGWRSTYYYIGEASGYYWGESYSLLSMEQNGKNTIKVLTSYVLPYEECKHLMADGFCWCELRDTCEDCGYTFPRSHFKEIEKEIDRLAELGWIEMNKETMKKHKYEVGQKLWVTNEAIGSKNLPVTVQSIIGEGEEAFIFVTNDWKKPVTGTVYPINSPMLSDVAPFEPDTEWEAVARYRYSQAQSKKLRSIDSGLFDEIVVGMNAKGWFVHLIEHHDIVDPEDEVYVGIFEGLKSEEEAKEKAEKFLDFTNGWTTHRVSDPVTQSSDTVFNDFATKYPMDPKTCGHMFDWYSTTPPTQCLKCGVALGVQNVWSGHSVTDTDTNQLFMSASGFSNTSDEPECGHVTYGNIGNPPYWGEQVWFPYCPKCGEKL